MKASFSNGITVEGTPKEVAEFKRLLDEQAAYKPVNPYQGGYSGVKPWITWTGGGVNDTGYGYATYK